VFSRIYCKQMPKSYSSFFDTPAAIIRHPRAPARLYLKIHFPSTPLIPMKTTIRCFALTTALIVASASQAQSTTSTLKTRNVILVFADGVRWQDVFRGPDTDLMVPAQGVAKAASLIKQYDLPTTEARRAKL